ncbi:MAG: CHAT domain-containing protein, partial [Myxococcales bacterium]|nr:CHAT domain-containing protein [Myxococcales bacterium]
GTQWEVVDGQSATFAAAFYAELVTGASIGSAVRRAREAVVARGGEGELAWASYVLYGDPTFTPLRREEARALVIPSAKQLDARSSAPWKRPRLRESPRSLATRGGAPEGEAIARRARRPWLLAAAIGAAVGVLLAALAALLLTRSGP